MACILSDAAFTTVEITDNLYFRKELLVDENRNIHANVVHCNTLMYTNLAQSNGVSSTPIMSMDRDLFVAGTNPSPQTLLAPSHMELLDKLQGDQNVHSEEVGAVVIGGQFNEASGAYSTCVGGQYNEASGHQSICMGGVENQAVGECATAMGVTSTAMHDNTFVWNGNADQPLETTATKQCMIGCDNGLFFKLPKSTDIKTHLVPDGFACWCWDEAHKTLCLKTKQANTLYKTLLPTLVHEIQVGIDPSTGTVQLINPDDH